MKFFTAITALMATTVAAMPTLIERDVKTINSSIATLSSKVVALNQSLNAYNVNSLTQLPALLNIISKANDVSTAQTNAAKAANASQPLDFSDSLTVGLAVLAFEPQIFSLLDNFERRKADFDKVVVAFSVRKTVLQTLQQQKTLAAQLGAAIKAKIDSSLYSLADSINSDIASKFDEAIKVYSVPGKGIDLPPLPSGTTRRDLEAMMEMEK